MRQCNDAKEPEEKCPADVLSSNMNTFILQNSGLWAPTSWYNKAYAMYAGPAGLEQKRAESVWLAGFRDWNEHDQEEAIKKLRRQISTGKVDNQLLYRHIQHFTLMFPVCVSQRVAHAATITEAIMNTCKFKNLPDLKLVIVKDDTAVMAMNQFDVDLEEEIFDEISHKGLLLSDQMKYISGLKTDADIIYDKLKNENELYFERGNHVRKQCYESVEETFLVWFEQDLKLNTEREFEIKMIQERIDTLQRLIDTGRVVSLSTSTRVSVHENEIQVPIFDQRYGFRQNFFVQVPKKIYHDLMHYFETESDDDLCQYWIDLTRTLHCDTFMCRADEYWNWYSLWSSQNNPMSKYFEAKNAKMQREVRAILSGLHTQTRVDPHHNDDALTEIVDNIVVLKTMWHFFKQVQAPEIFHEKLQDGLVSSADGESDSMQAFKENEWNNIKRLFSILVLSNRVKHMPEKKQDENPRDNVSLLVRFLYGELSIFNEVIRVNDIFQEQNIEMDEQNRQAAILKQFPWFVIQKILKTREASKMSQTLVESSTSLTIMDTDFGAFIVFVGLVSFFWCLMGRPFGGVIEHFLKEVLGLNFMVAKAVVEIVKEAVLAWIGKTRTVMIENAQGGGDEDTQASGLLAIQDAHDAVPSTVNDHTRTVTVETYLQALRGRLEIVFETAGIWTEFGYQYIHNDELLKSHMGTNLNLPDVLTLDSVVEKLVHFVKIEQFNLNLRVERGRVNVIKIREERIQECIAKLLKGHGLVSVDDLVASVENLQEAVNRAEVKKKSIAKGTGGSDDSVHAKASKIQNMRASMRAEAELRLQLKERTDVQVKISKLMQRMQSLGGR